MPSGHLPPHQSFVCQERDLVLYCSNWDTLVSEQTLLIITPERQGQSGAGQGTQGDAGTEHLLGEAGRGSTDTKAPPRTHTQVRKHTPSPWRDAVPAKENSQRPPTRATIQDSDWHALKSTPVSTRSRTWTRLNHSGVWSGGWDGLRRDTHRCGGRFGFHDTVMARV